MKAIYKAGDVRGVMKYDSEASDTSLFMQVDGWREIAASPESVTLIHPKFNEGEIVLWQARSAKILVIRDDFAWLKFLGGMGDRVVPLSELERASPEVEKLEKDNAAAFAAAHLALLLAFAVVAFIIAGCERRNDFTADQIKAVTSFLKEETQCQHGSKEQDCSSPKQ